LVAAAVVLGACGTSESGTTPSSAVESAPSGPSLDITIAGGQVTPTNAALEAQVGTPITLNVTSDAADELHVHAVPEYTFEVKAAPAQTFQFTVDVPGRVEVELHELHRTVVTIQVRP
jgi:heme/copper-type cytochrome/quinol oxidase subunit 2